MKRFRTQIAAMILGATCVGAAAPVLAQSTASRAANAIAVEVLPGWRAADGQHIAGLQITLAPGWTTYWRVPGEAGIPPRSNWNQSRNLDAISMRWPRPEIETKHDIQSIVYRDRFVVPLILTPDTPGHDLRLRGTLKLGVCSDICLPVDIDVDHVLPAAETTEYPAIQRALAAGPVSADSIGMAETTCHLRPISDGLRITAIVPIAAQTGEFGVIEHPDQNIWVSMPEVTRSGGALHITSDFVPIKPQGIAVDRSNLRITVFGGDRMIDIQGCVAG